MDILLNAWEYKAAVDLANARMSASNAAGHNHASTYSRTHNERITEEIIGACGEMALCKAMNWFWSPSVNTFHGIPDVGADVEVRGWIWGRDGRNPEWIRDPGKLRQAWFVPQSALRPIPAPSTKPNREETQYV